MLDSRNGSIPPAALWAYRLGMVSTASVFISLFLGFAFESIGINSLLLSYVIPLSLVTVFLAVTARGKMEDKKSPGYREATWGLRMGLGVLVSVVAFIIGVAVFFTLLLPRG